MPEIDAWPSEDHEMLLISSGRRTTTPLVAISFLLISVPGELAAQGQPV